MKKLLVFLMVLTVGITMVACGGTKTSEKQTEMETVEETTMNTEPIEGDEIGSLYSNPDDYKGRLFNFTAKVFSIEEDSGMLGIQAWQDIKNSDNNTIIYAKSPKGGVKEDDYIKVDSIVDGAFKGENAYGTEVEAVQVTGKIKVIDAVKANKANKTIKLNEKISTGGVTVTLKKVDFTDTETRLYLKITNKSGSKFSSYPDQGVIIQGGKQYDTTYNDEYPELSTELHSGASTEGIVVFKKIKQKNFKYTFTGYNEKNYDDIKFTYNVKIK